MRENVDRLAMFPDLVAQAIRRSVVGNAIERVETARAQTWLPVELDVFLTNAVAEGAGPEGLDAWSRAAIRNSIEGPLLRPIVNGAVRLFGLRPSGFLGMMPRIFDHIYRNAGRIVRDAGDDESHIHLRYVDIPEVIVESPAYLHSVAAAMAVALELCRVDGEVQLVREAPNATTLQFRWENAARTRERTEVRVVA